ncbi:hypothetical protein GCM10027059_45720 [Myceligenerans halotolerans]
MKLVKVTGYALLALALVAFGVGLVSGLADGEYPAHYFDMGLMCAIAGVGVFVVGATDIAKVAFNKASERQE